jgi:hypothetical protein
MNNKIQSLELMEFLIKNFLDDSAYETNGFLKPEWKVYNKNDNYDFDHDDMILIVIRLSAPGCLDCTYWTPICDDEDLTDWFNLYCLTIT